MISSEDKVPNDLSCLVARAVPCALPAQPVCSFEPKLETDAEKKDEKNNDTDTLVSNFLKLSVNSTTTTTVKKPMKVADPADFVTLQSLRSSALARKTNTTSKFGRDGANLFADLLSNDEEDKAVQKNSEKKQVETHAEKTEKPKDAKDVEEPLKEKKPASKEEKENKEDSQEDESELLSRGPVRASRVNTNYHPYAGSNPYPNSNESFDQACAAFSQPAAILTPSSTPDTVSSDLGYSSSSTSPHQQQCTSSNYSANNTCAHNTVLPAKNDTELPDALSDFILKYSRSYQSQQNTHKHEVDENGVLSPKIGRPPSADSNLCDSPLSAGIASESSPADPHGGFTGPSTPSNDYRGCNKMGPLRTQLPSGQYTAYLGRQNGGYYTEQHARPAKEVLRKMIRAEDMDDAWAWTCKCMQNYPGSICHQDKDRDTLLHIVTVHLDLAKIYALTEQMLKTDYPGNQKPFDMKNRYNETPLFFAVEKRHNEVVDYLLEAGADPNCQNSRAERDGPLHLAARLGMSEIVKTICSYNITNLNALNGKGLTPLLCAVVNHGVYEREGGYIVDNTQTIQYLLKFGADPLIADATDGRTAMHYAAARMAPEVVDIFKQNLDEETMTQLVNRPDNNGETALANVQASTNADESTRFKLGLLLIMCGANNSTNLSP